MVTLDMTPVICIWSIYAGICVRHPSLDQSFVVGVNERRYKVNVYVVWFRHL